MKSDPFICDKLAYTPLPPFYTFIRSRHIKKIDVSSNKFGGVIPSVFFLNEALPDDDTMESVSSFQSLQVLTLSRCQLTGQIPAWLAKLRKLKVLDLSDNYCSGPIPSWLEILLSIYYIDLSYNFIWGNLPELPALTTISSEDDKKYACIQKGQPGA
ncbi:tyrosine-sulfated glycopeptide receptor 1-like [Tripterygium wilfordii]|uniref:tyrosine-sulfated glycopeptide receptor 1-like n=1 Tax=Tripterygium wilfordii TaxID=458696 RepID=UPI0018F832B5|nr:tyrosine-sulfated glycopeptide receptor 1-like [Tripterygium wilfordii]